MKDHNTEEICSALGIDPNEIVNVYPYGSRVYGTADEFSDHDYVLVYKRGLLPSGAFKDNAKSSTDRKIQGTCYSRGGFIDAINRYDITALECVLLPKELVVQEKMKFGITKYNEREMANCLVAKASSSWHFARLAYDDGNTESCIKNTWHAIRILDFGIQIKLTGTINYSSTNELRKEMFSNYSTFDPRDYDKMFLRFSDELKKI